MYDIINSLNYNVSSIKDITSITFNRDFLKQKHISDKITDFVPELRKWYSSAFLTCLHKNSYMKQKNPGINLLRQVLKCNYLNMKPKVISHGYEKTSGKKLQQEFL